MHSTVSCSPHSGPACSSDDGELRTIGSNQTVTAALGGLVLHHDAGGQCPDQVASRRPFAAPVDGAHRRLGHLLRAQDQGKRAQPRVAQPSPRRTRGPAQDCGVEPVADRQRRHDPAPAPGGWIAPPRLPRRCTYTPPYAFPSPQVALLVLAPVARVVSPTRTQFGRPAHDLAPLCSTRCVDEPSRSAARGDSRRGGSQSSPVTARAARPSTWDGQVAALDAGAHQQPATSPVALPVPRGPRRSRVVPADPGVARNSRRRRGHTPLDPTPPSHAMPVSPPDTAVARRRSKGPVRRCGCSCAIEEYFQVLKSGCSVEESPPAPAPSPEPRSTVPWHVKPVVRHRVRLMVTARAPHT